MLDDPSEVIRALLRYRDIFDPRTGSILLIGGARDPVGRDPFRGGFIAGMEERTELLKRLQKLDPRKRQVLCLWYMAGLPVVQIARRVRISRMHCYRLRNQAFEQMCPPRKDGERAEVSAPAPAG